MKTWLSGNKDEGAELVWYFNEDSQPVVERAASGQCNISINLISY